MCYGTMHLRLEVHACGHQGVSVRMTATAIYDDLRIWQHKVVVSVLTDSGYVTLYKATLLEYLLAARALQPQQRQQQQQKQPTNYARRLSSKCSWPK